MRAGISSDSPRCSDDTVARSAEHSSGTENAGARARAPPLPGSAVPPFPSRGTFPALPRWRARGGRGRGRGAWRGCGGAGRAGGAHQLGRAGGFSAGEEKADGEGVERGAMDKADAAGYEVAGAGGGSRE